MHRVYLDTSAIVKRYVVEKGSDLLGELYRASGEESLSLQFSFWNVGEVLGVLDMYRKRSWITKAEEERVLGIFSTETVKLVKLASLEVLPVLHSHIAESWKLVRRHHLYQADALQVTTAARSGASMFLTADADLLEAARSEGLTGFDVESEGPEIREAIL